MPRIAIIDKEKCKPSKCSRECIKKCPPQRSGKQVIDIEDICSTTVSTTTVSTTTVFTTNALNTTNKNKIAKIFESQCIGCGQCVTACPFSAIKIINVPEENPADIVHRYGPNAFRLYKLPVVKKNCVIGLIGQNGIGKSTLVDILSGRILPNFEQPLNKLPTKDEIIKKFRGSVMQTYLKDLYQNKLSFSIKDQKIKQMIQPLLRIKQNLTVNDFLRNENINIDLLSETLIESFNNLELNKLLNSHIQTLSGGELQRLLIFKTCAKKADVYIFDEPSNFLDIKQRLMVAKLIRSMISTNTYVIVIEHDLSLMDYMADDIHILFGVPSAYGIVSNPLTVANAINEYLEGYISGQNIRFREEVFNLKPQVEIFDGIFSDEIADEIPDRITDEIADEITDGTISIEPTNNNKQNSTILSYNSTIISLSKNSDTAIETNSIETNSTESIRDLSLNPVEPNFNLTIPGGQINLAQGSINVILGENGTGKTTFIKYLFTNDNLGISYKDQHTNIKKYLLSNTTYPTVLEMFYHYIRKSYLDPVFQTDVINNLNIKQLEGRTLDELSGGELQRVMITMCLGTPANVYLLDEPSSNLDIENRLAVTKAIKKFAKTNQKSVFVIEHDIMMAVSMAQEYGSKILFVKKDMFDTTTNTKYCSVSEPLDFSTGINRFLSEMNITMRIAGHNRPRINKYGSQMDQEQKRNGKYYGN